MDPPGHLERLKLMNWKLQILMSKRRFSDIRSIQILLALLDLECGKMN